jgi:hypothetical protein
VQPGYVSRCAVNGAWGEAGLHVFHGNEVLMCSRASPSTPVHRKAKPLEANENKTFQPPFLCATCSSCPGSFTSFRSTSNPRRFSDRLTLLARGECDVKDIKACSLVSPLHFSGWSHRTCAIISTTVPTCIQPRFSVRSTLRRFSLFSYPEKREKQKQ